MDFLPVCCSSAKNPAISGLKGAVIGLLVPSVGCRSTRCRVQSQCSDCCGKLCNCSPLQGTEPGIETGSCLRTNRGPDLSLFITGTVPLYCDFLGVVLCKQLASISNYEVS